MLFSRHLGGPGKVLEEVWCVWVESWALLTSCWRPWGAWGASRGCLGRLFGVLGAFGGVPGEVWGSLGRPWRGLGAKNQKNKNKTFCFGTPKWTKNHEKSFPKAFWSSEGVLSMLLIALS